MNAILHPIEKEELMALVDNELSRERRAVVEAHLEHCSECRALARDLRAVSERLRVWSVPPAPAPIRERVMAALDERLSSPASHAKPSFPQTARRRFSRGLRWAFGLTSAAAALLFIAALAIPNLLRSRSAAPRPVRMVTNPPVGSSLSESSTPQAPSSGLEPTGPMIVRTAALSLATNEFDTARAAIERIVIRHRGYLAQLTVSGHAGQARSLAATLRVPSDQLGAALNELKQLGRIEEESQSGEEITAQFVDLNARLANARHTEQRLIEVLSRRTGRVTDVLEVEREIARVRGEIERMEAQRKDMENRVGFAAVQVRLSEEYKANIEVAPPSPGIQLRNATIDGYRMLLDNGLGLGLALLRYGPSLLFWVVILFWPARLVWRRLRA